jgi:hypothetical protein
MALKLKDLYVNNKEAVIEFPAGELKITYNPNKITTKHLTTAATGLEELCDILLEFLVSWDLVDEANATMPLTKESLQDLKVSILNEIFEGILADAFPKVKSTR